MPDGKKDKSKDYLLGLHWAATTGNVGLVKFALDHGAPIDSVVNGFMPLQLACINDNNIAVVQYLIDRGAEVNAQRWSKKHSTDKSQAVAGAIGSTALHVACANGCTKIVDLLLRNGAKVQVKDKYGSRPMDIAAAKHHAEIVKLLETFAALQQGDAAERPGGRRSMDASMYHYRVTGATATATTGPTMTSDRLRRPSLPSMFERRSQTLDIPPVLTMPPPSRIPPSSHHHIPSSIDIRRRRASQHRVPELASSKSSDDTSLCRTPASPEDSSRRSCDSRRDWYSYGVAHHDPEESYLASLERRAYRLDDSFSRPRQSLDHVRTPADPRPSLKRCSSDGSHLRTAALINATAAHLTPAHDAMRNGEDDDEPMPRPSLALDDGPEANALRHFEEKEIKRAWWSAFGGRKSMDVATFQYHQPRSSMDAPRKSIDFRPSFDGLSQIAKRSVEGLAYRRRDSQDIAYDPDDCDMDPSLRKPARPGFLSRLVGAWSSKR